MAVTRGSHRRWIVASLAALATAWSAAASAKETRSFVLNWFTDANYYAGEGKDSACPDGLNLSAIEFYRRDLLALGHPKEKVEEVLKDFPGEGGLTQPWVPLVIVRGNGKDNVYANPQTWNGPPLKTVKGKYGYGFDLDGRADTDDFIDPVTGERGVDNQLYRAMGCIRSYRGLPAPARPTQPETHWDVLRNVMPAWVISVTAENGFDQDGPITVKFNRATQRVTRDVSGVNVQADMSFTLDPDPRTHNSFTGRMKEGVITTDVSRFNMMLDEYIAHELNFDRARMRLEFTPDGKLTGMIGGYQPWYPIYYGVSYRAHITEYAASIDVPAVYHALKKMADADPDPKTGENQSISTTWLIEGVRAFIAGPENKTAAAAPAR